MMNLVQTVYVSLPTIPVHEVILDIVRAAEARNERMGVSGLLFFSDFAYMQLLEGPEQAVSDLYDMIERDFRHGVVQVETRLSKRRVIASSLPMGYVQRCIDLEFVADLHQQWDRALVEFRKHALEVYPSAAVPA